MALKINFTKAALEAIVCPPEKSDILVYDTETKGLALRVTRAGGKTFYVIRKIKGKDKRKKLEFFNAKSTKLPLIRETALKVYANMDAILIAEATKAKREAITVDMAFDNMLKRKKKLSSRTIEDYNLTYTNYIKARYGSRALSSITSEDVLDLHAEITEPVLRKNGELTAPRERSANKAVGLLRGIFSFSIALYKNEDGHSIFKYNPVDIMKYTKQWHDNNRDKVRINPNKLNDFIKGCIEVADTQPLREVPTSFKPVSAAVLFMLFSGVRPGEISKIKRAFVCHKTRAVVFPKKGSSGSKTTLKNGKEFHLVLNDTAYCQLLYSMKHTTGEYVFPGVHQETMSESSVRDFLTRVSASVGSHLPRKIGRASFMSTAERAGVSAFHIKVLCNHGGHGQTVDVTDGYKTAYLSEIRKATSQIETEILASAGLAKDVVCRGLLSTLETLDTRSMDTLFVSI
ncbi:recombinase [Pseudomonas sp. LS-2]|uniref:recombinase n=1 Tax=Pseudomonas sp. LS-2 TaxID=2315859 RepID=UPI000E743ECD|nr:recombinase [Pseudomonas sp. LS-2]RJX78926.1 recombinase [Pseudomonas sp. LS-2]